MGDPIARQIHSGCGRRLHVLATAGVLALGLLLATACASPAPDNSPSYHQLLSEWSGDTEYNLVTAWGVPAKTHVLADGGRVIEYSQMGEDREFLCKTRFTLDETGKIVRWWYHGNECHAPEDE